MLQYALDNLPDDTAIEKLSNLEEKYENTVKRIGESEFPAQKDISFVVAYIGALLTCKQDREQGPFKTCCLANLMQESG